TVAAETGSIVPVACSTCRTVCVLTVAVRYVGASLRVDAYAVTPPATTRTPTATPVAVRARAVVPRRVRLRIRARPRRAGRTGGPAPAQPPAARTAAAPLPAT